MALETPNRMAASINVFFAEANSLPPGEDNEQITTVVASEGIASFQLMPEPNFMGEISDGFFLELQNPVRVTNGTWFGSGWPGFEWNEDPLLCNLTPLAQGPETGNEVVDGWAASDGNFLCLFPGSPDNPFGFFGVGIFEIPLVEGDPLSGIQFPQPGGGE